MCIRDSTQHLLAARPRGQRGVGAALPEDARRGLPAQVPAVKRLVVGISGASGAIYGVRFLELLRGVPDVEAHLIISDAGRRTIVEETDYSVEAVEALAPRRYRNRDIGAAVASGSFKTAGTITMPVSYTHLR